MKEDFFESLCRKAKLDIKPHQVDGHIWCLENEYTNGGGILADEMGLGKTIAMLALICINPKNNLIVVPPALLKQWKFVMNKFIKVTPFIFHGSVVKSVTTESIKNSEIVLTTYGMISTRKKSYKSVLWDVEWGRVIYDEAHNMRDMKSNAFSGAIKIKSEIKWMVTGTPIQNRPEDIYSLALLLGERIRGNEHLKEFIKNRLIRRTKKRNRYKNA